MKADRPDIEVRSGAGSSHFLPSNAPISNDYYE